MLEKTVFFNMLVLKKPDIYVFVCCTLHGILLRLH